MMQEQLYRPREPEKPSNPTVDLEHLAASKVRVDGQECQDTRRLFGGKECAVTSGSSKAASVLESGSGALGLV